MLSGMKQWSIFILIFTFSRLIQQTTSSIIAQQTAGLGSLDGAREAKCFACLRNVTSILKIDTSQRCEGPFCGPYQISYTYWAEAGKPGNRQGASRDFEKCARDMSCAESTVRAYYRKFKRDCNNDGQLDCLDMAALHKGGPASCSSDWFYKSRFWVAFNKTSCVTGYQQDLAGSQSPGEPSMTRGSNRKTGNPLKNQTLTSECLDCICEATSNCNTNFNQNCGSTACGPFAISQTYWKDGKRPGASWMACTKTRECSTVVIKNYMDKYKRDCNDDGVITCEDYAALHRNGPRQCSNKDLLKDNYWNKFLSCRNNQHAVKTPDANLVKLSDSSSSSSSSLASPDEAIFSTHLDNNGFPKTVDKNTIKDNAILKNLVTNAPASELNPASVIEQSVTKASSRIPSSTMTPSTTGPPIRTSSLSSGQTQSSRPLTASTRYDFTQTAPFIDIPSFILDEMLNASNRPRPKEGNSGSGIEAAQQNPETMNQNQDARRDTSTVQVALGYEEKSTQAVRIATTTRIPAINDIRQSTPKSAYQNSMYHINAQSKQNPIPVTMPPVVVNPSSSSPSSPSPISSSTATTNVPISTMSPSLSSSTKQPITTTSTVDIDSLEDEDFKPHQQSTSMSPLVITLGPPEITDFTLPEFPPMDEGTSSTNFNKVITDIIGNQAFSKSNEMSIETASPSAANFPLPDLPEVGKDQLPQAVIWPSSSASNQTSSSLQVKPTSVPIMIVAKDSKQTGNPPIRVEQQSMFHRSTIENINGAQSSPQTKSQQHSMNNNNNNNDNMEHRSELEPSTNPDLKSIMTTSIVPIPVEMDLSSILTSSNLTIASPNRVPSECLECICEASSNCDTSVQCISKQREKNRCGLYMISWNQFLESDIMLATPSPVSSSSSTQATTQGSSTNPSSSNSKSNLKNHDTIDEKFYIDCSTDKICAERLINLYIEKHQKDCNNDGKIDCYDIAALHRVGPNNCASSKLIESQYWKDFNTCYVSEQADEKNQHNKPTTTQTET